MSMISMLSEIGRESAFFLLAEWPQNCTLLYRDELQRNPSYPRGALPPRPPTRASVSCNPFPPFGNVQFVTIKMWYYPACARTQIKRNLDSAPWQTNSRFFSLISDKLPYVPRHSSWLSTWLPRYIIYYYLCSGMWIILVDVAKSLL